MRGILDSIREGIPRPIIAVLAVGLAFTAFLTVDQIHWWRLKPDYAFGWLVPFFVIYVVADRWPRLREIFRSEGPSPMPAWLRLAVSSTAGLGLAAGVACFLIGSLYRGAAGTTQPGSLALAIGFACMLVSMVYFNTPDGVVGNAGGSGLMHALRADARLRAAALFLFPALIWILSAPLASAVENAVSLFLLRKVVVVVFAIFDTLGYSLMREGNVLVLPRGQVGVADACSGIRSLTGCLFAGSFLAAVFLDRLWKKLVLIAAALIAAFFANLLRSLFLTAWAYAYGSEAIEGTLHDATGYAVLGLTSVCLLGLLPLFRSRPPLGAPEPLAGSIAGRP